MMRHEYDKPEHDVVSHDSQNVTETSPLSALLKVARPVDSARHLDHLMSRPSDLPVVCLRPDPSPIAAEHSIYYCGKKIIRSTRWHTRSRPYPEHFLTKAVVYLLCTHNLDLFKIGYSLDLYVRMKSLKHLSVLSTFPCCCEKHARVLEAVVHHSISHLRVRGEYFDLDDSQLERVYECFTSLCDLTFTSNQNYWLRTPLDIVWFSRCLTLIEEMRQAVRSPHA